MIAKLSVGIGRFGKLWTGTKLRPAHEDESKLWDGEKVIPNIVDAVIIERTCACGASTRKFRGRPVQASTEALTALDLPTVFITAGGVGSIYFEYDESKPIPVPYREHGRSKYPDLLVWNWSGRVGGHVIVNPVAVLGGYVNRESLPAAKAGYQWVQTYWGSTLSEFVLLREDQRSHALPVVKLAGTCPPCREAREIEEKRAKLDPAVASLLEQAMGKACSVWARVLNGPHTEDELLGFLRENIGWAREKLNWQSLALPGSWLEVLNA